MDNLKCILLTLVLVPAAVTSSPHAGTAKSQANQRDGREDSSPGGGDFAGGGGGMGARDDFGDVLGEGDFFRFGGRVGYAMGTPKVTKGFINKDPDSVTDEQSIADNRYTKVPEGTMIMNQPQMISMKSNLTN